MNYFASHLGKVPENLPSHDRVQIGEKGTLLVFSDKPLETESPEHMAVVDSVMPDLKAAGLIQN